jgi:hypothetical protein
LNFGFFGSYDVTWDGFKRGNSREQDRRRIGNMDFLKKKRVGRVGGTCGRKP